MSTDQSYQPYDSPPQAEGSSRSSGKCLIWGCLIGLLMVILLIALVLGGTYWFYQRQITRFTDEKPMEIPVVDVTEEEVEEVKERITRFKQTVEPPSDGDPATVDEASTDTTADSAAAGDGDEDTESDAEPVEASPTELVLTARDINALIAGEPELRGRAYVDIEDGQISGKVSFPTDFVPGGGGRFFNADANFEVSMHDGILIVRLVDARVNGERLPESVRQAFASENLAKDAYKDPKNAEMLRQFESIDVVDDTIVLKLRSPEERSNENGDEATDQTLAEPTGEQETSRSELAETMEPAETAGVDEPASLEPAR